MALVRAISNPPIIGPMTRINWKEACINELATDQSSFGIKVVSDALIAGKKKQRTVLSTNAVTARCHTVSRSSQ
ncbi:Uncharacterised protein [Mycobacterium tuberculosis]|nr:Uncharacterised protein [Mycobacterium tuberculosis]